MDRAAWNLDPFSRSKHFHMSAHDEAKTARQHRVDLVHVVLVIGKHGPGLIDVFRNAVAKTFELRAEGGFGERPVSRIPAVRSHEPVSPEPWRRRIIPARR